MNELTKQEAVKSFIIIKPDVILIELDKAPDTAGKSGLIVRPGTNKARQENQSESGVVAKMYEPDKDEDIDDSAPLFKKFKLGDRITFMDYAAPRGPFQQYPELRVIGLSDIIAKLATDKSIMD